MIMILSIKSIVYVPVWSQIRIARVWINRVSKVVVVVVCVCRHPIYSGRKVCGRTSRGETTGGRSHRISPPYFCGACLSFSREKD